MLLHHRMLKGLKRPLMEVDKTLKEQGFKRINHDKIEYQLTLQDPVTRSSYSLVIPCTLIPDNNEYIRLGNPYLKKRYSYHPLDKHTEIPRFIRNAAEDKAAEVFTYLSNIGKP